MSGKPQGPRARPPHLPNWSRRILRRETIEDIESRINTIDSLCCKPSLQVSYIDLMAAVKQLQYEFSFITGKTNKGE